MPKVGGLIEVGPSPLSRGTLKPKVSLSHHLVGVQHNSIFSPTIHPFSSMQGVGYVRQRKRIVQGKREKENNSVTAYFANG